nr:MAG TPA: hypothetical protein [Caudoviricetes sp.]
MRFICTEDLILNAFFVLSIFLRSKCGQIFMSVQRYCLGD